MRRTFLIITVFVSLVFGTYARNENRTGLEYGPGDGDSTKKDTAKYTQYKNLPLKPTRKIKYNTKEGSWMSLDVSPDGQSIVFDLMGDIYTMPVAGGTATPVTKGLA